MIEFPVITLMEGYDAPAEEHRRTQILRTAQKLRR